MTKLPQDLLAIIERQGTVVVPTRQRAEAVRLAYAAAALQAGRRVWRTPDVLPLDAWLTREIQILAAGDPQYPRLLSPAEDWLLWREATLELTGDLELIARAPLAEALRRADVLLQEFELEPGAVRGSEHALLLDVRQAVHERQRLLGTATAMRLASSLPGLGDQRPVLFAGFPTLTPQLNTLIAARRAQGWETLVGAAMADGARPLRVEIAESQEDELERIAHWARRLLQADPQARLLVILPGAAAARERLATLLRQAFDPAAVLSGIADSNTPVVIEGGDSLHQLPMVAHALASLRWLTERGEFADLSEWLRAPWWRAPDLAPRSRLDIFLRERLPLEPRLEDLLAALAQAPGSLLPAAQTLSMALKQAQNKLKDGKASPREWSERLHAALDALGWQGGRALSSDEHQTGKRFLDLLRELGGLDAATGPIGRAAAVQWLQELAANTSFRPASGDALVTISPAFADPVVHYDGIWVAGLQADAWPQAAAPNPFLPLKIQIAAGVPAASAAGRLQQAQALMNSWMMAAGELVLSAPSRDGDMELLPSPLLRADSYQGQADSKIADLPLWLPLRLHRDGCLETFADSQGLAWPAQLPLPAGTRSLELQNECPFRAYAQLRLGCEPLYVPEPGVAADERGGLLHLALEKFWREVKGSQTLTGMSAESLEHLIVRCLQAAAAILWPLPAGATRSPAQERELKRTRRLMATLGELERQRAPFTVTHTEFESNLALAGAQLRVRIDRLDTLASGGLAILDYKSGRPIPADWYGERPSHLQLLTYLLSVGEGAQAMATVNVTAREVRFDGLAAQANLLPRVRAVEGPRPGAEDAWNLRYAEWYERLESLARQFLLGYAAVDPRPRACDYCHLASLCRIDELGIAGDEEAADV